MSFSGKVYFCPFIRVEVGDLTTVVARGGLERRALRRRCASGCVEHGIFPVCRRCCKVELSPVPVPADASQGAARAAPRDSVDGGPLT